MLHHRGRRRLRRLAVLNSGAGQTKTPLTGQGRFEVTESQSGFNLS